MPFLPHLIKLIKVSIANFENVGWHGLVRNFNAPCLSQFFYRSTLVIIANKILSKIRSLFASMTHVWWHTVKYFTCLCLKKKEKKLYTIRWIKKRNIFIFKPFLMHQNYTVKSSIHIHLVFGMKIADIHTNYFNVCSSKF